MLCSLCVEIMFCWTSKKEKEKKRRFPGLIGYPANQYMVHFQQNTFTFVVLSEREGQRERERRGIRTRNYLIATAGSNVGLHYQDTGLHKSSISDGHNIIVH